MLSLALEGQGKWRWQCVDVTCHSIHIVLSKGLLCPFFTSVKSPRQTQHGATYPCSVSYRSRSFQMVLSFLCGNPYFRYIVDTQEMCPGTVSPSTSLHRPSPLTSAVLSILQLYPPIMITRTPITASWWPLHLAYLLTSPRQGAGSMRTWLIPNHAGAMYTVGKCLPAHKWTNPQQMDRVIWG